MKIVYVNRKKEQRAIEILSLVTGVTVPKKPSETETRDKFGAMLKAAEVDPNSEEAVQFVYEKLGGLVRTEAEQKKADALKVEMSKKGKRKMIE